MVASVLGIKPPFIQHSKKPRLLQGQNISIDFLQQSGLVFSNGDAIVFPVEAIARDQELRVARHLIP